MYLYCGNMEGVAPVESMLIYGIEGIRLLRDFQTSQLHYYVLLGCTVWS